MKIKFWGTRGSVPTPGPATVRYGGNTPCVEVRAGDTLLILDAGSGIRELGRSLMNEFGNRPIRAHVFLSHTHWDHIQGLPFFTPAFVAGNYLSIHGCEGAHGRLRHILAGQMENAYFPVPLEAMAATKKYCEISSPEFMIEDVVLKSTFLNHPGLSLGYRIEYQGKVAVYCTDHEPLTPAVIPAPESAENPHPGKHICTGEPNRNLYQFAQDADLFITDSQYTTEEYVRKAGWGHCTIEDAVQLAMKAQIKQLALFHHDPEHDDQKIDEMVAHAQALLQESGSQRPAPEHCVGAQEGMEFIL